MKTAVKGKEGSVFPQPSVFSSNRSRIPFIVCILKVVLQFKKAVFPPGANQLLMDTRHNGIVIFFVPE